MIDIHCHIIYDTDDGARDPEETMEMCEIAVLDGISAIIATPHYIQGEGNNERVKEKIELLNEELKKNSIELRILPGNEIYLARNSYENLLNNECFTLNNSRYALVEFSMTDVPDFAFDALYNMQVKSFVPIIAHPERNYRILQQPNLVYDFIKEGCLVQINSTSLTGLGGKEIKNFSEMLIKHNMVHFIASDAHSVKNRKPVLSKAYYLADSIGGTGVGQNLICKNPKAVIENREIKAGEPIRFKAKKRLFDIF